MAALTAAQLWEAEVLESASVFTAVLFKGRGHPRDYREFTNPTDAFNAADTMREAVKEVLGPLAAAAGQPTPE